VNLTVVVAVFPIVLLGSCPTRPCSTRWSCQLAAGLFAWFGAAGASVVHVVIATTIGVALFHWRRERALNAIVGLTIPAVAWSSFDAEWNVLF
jgi:hypothetical protein